MKSEFLKLYKDLAEDIPTPDRPAVIVGVALVMGLAELSETIREVASAVRGVGYIIENKD